MNWQLLPSILSADHGMFVEESKTVDMPEIDYLHIDVMDGHFVPNITFGPQVVASLKQHTRFKLDVHLMISNPDLYVPAFAKAGADIITIHQEATHHLQRSLALIREQGVGAGVAINPATPLEAIEWVLGDVEQVLVMSVNPGFGGQKFIPTTLPKLRRLKTLRSEENYRFSIEVDGGIDESTIAKAWHAGAEKFVAGSAVFGKSDRKAAVKLLLRKLTDSQQKLV
jgi:ribulose-phosphate 3-epimerase